MLNVPYTFELNAAGFVPSRYDNHIRRTLTSMRGQYHDAAAYEAMLAEGVDRLVARTGNGARLKQHLLASHSFAADAGRIAMDAGVGRLVLHHLIPADDPAIGPADWERAVRETWSGPLTIGRDGLLVEFGAGRQQEPQAAMGGRE